MDPKENKFAEFSRQTFDKEWELIKQKNREEDEHARKLMQSIKQTQLKSQQTQRRIEQTLRGVKTSLTDIKQTNQKIDTFKKQYEQAMDKLTERLFLSLTNPIKKQVGVQYQNLPVEVDMEQAVKEMMKYDNILFLTGAGLSAESGIPTFRGTGGYWTCKIKEGEKEYNAEEVLTRNFFKQHPEIVWKWHEDFNNTAKKCKSGAGHLALDRCCRQLVKHGKKVTIITQNLDNLQPHPQKVPFYHIHGDIRYIQCTNKHLTDFSLTQKKCRQCGADMRPHTLFFDEPCVDMAPTEVKEGKYPFTVSIGTALETTLAKRLVTNSKEVIEINPEPAIEVGKVYTFRGTAGDVLTKMEKSIKDYK